MGMPPFPPGPIKNKKPHSSTFIEKWGSKIDSIPSLRARTIGEMKPIGIIANEDT
jgi:hypothetical protein